MIFAFELLLYNNRDWLVFSQVLLTMSNTIRFKYQNRPKKAMKNISNQFVFVHLAVLIDQQNRTYLVKFP